MVLYLILILLIVAGIGLLYITRAKRERSLMKEPEQPIRPLTEEEKESAGFQFPSEKSSSEPEAVSEEKKIS